MVGESQRAPKDVPAGAAGSWCGEEKVVRQLLQEDDVLQRCVQVLYSCFSFFSLLFSGFTAQTSSLLRHMNTIELQLEVTRFLHRCETAAASKSAPTSPPSTKPSASLPTLFGGTPMKVEVACKVQV